MNMLNTISPLVETATRKIAPRFNTHWSDAEKAVLIAGRAARRTIPDIAAELGRPVSSVYDMARKLGTRVMPYTRWTEAMDTALREAVAEGGLTDAEIAARLDVSYASVRWRMSALELKREQKVRPAAERKTGGERIPRVRKARVEAAKHKTEAKNAWSAAAIAQLKELAASGNTPIAEAARLVGRPLGGVRAKAKALGLAFPMPQEIEARKADEALKEVWADVSDLSLAAERLGRSKTWVRERTLALGLRTEGARRGKRIDDAAKAEVRALATQMTVTEVARAVGRDVRTVKRIAEELGVTFREPVRPAPPPRPKSAAPKVAKPRVHNAVRKTPTVRAAKPVLVVVASPPEPARKVVSPPPGRLEQMRAVLAKMRAEGRMP